MNKVVLITGAARRIGATLARGLHAQGMTVVIHYRHSKQAAQTLSDELNQACPRSAFMINADLRDLNQCNSLITETIALTGQLNVLINNASSFYPTPLETATEENWNDLMSSNLKAPFFLSQAASVYLKKEQGCIINLIDIHAEKPLKNYSIYSIAKAGLNMLTLSLARELGPNIRVNGIAPGSILPPEKENSLSEEEYQTLIRRTALKRSGSPDDILKAVDYLIRADYVTGQVMAVDGGRSLFM